MPMQCRGSGNMTDKVYRLLLPPLCFAVSWDSVHCVEENRTLAFCLFACLFLLFFLLWNAGMFSLAEVSHPSFPLNSPTSSRSIFYECSILWKCYQLNLVLSLVPSFVMTHRLFLKMLVVFSRFQKMPTTVNLWREMIYFSSCFSEVLVYSCSSLLTLGLCKAVMFIARLFLTDSV